MDDFVTVLTVRYSHELLMIKGFLEAEGIEYFVKDELTIQSDPLWSNALGGIKLQVQKQDKDKAIALLTEFGYLKEEPFTGEDLLTRIDKKTSSIFVLKNLSIEKRIVIIILLGIIMITAITYYIIKPSKTELLCKSPWCVDYIYYKNNLIGPKTINNIYLESGNIPCNENIEFRTNGHVLLPGINTELILGDWTMTKGDILKLNVDTLQNIFNGMYSIEVTENRLILQSKTTIIYGHIDRTSTPNLFYPQR